LRETAVNRQLSARDVSRVQRSQEQHRARDFFGFAPATERNHCVDVSANLRDTVRGKRERSFGRARAHDIDADLEFEHAFVPGQ
jgi:hypothetical protein